MVLRPSIFRITKYSIVCFCVQYFNLSFLFELMQRDRLLTDADMQIAERDVRIAQLESELDGIA